ncbi:MAG: flagellar motor protein MotB [Dongiaceae bacterium]
MSGGGSQFGMGAGGGSHGGHPAAPVASAQVSSGAASMRARLDNLPQMTFRQAGIRNPSLPTLLSLFFLLLAFFIVLNSLSQRDAAKQHNVASSIGQTFGEGTGGADALSAADNTTHEVTGILTGLASYFGSLIPAGKQKLLISTNQLVLRLPVDLFFQPSADRSTAELMPQAAAMMRQLGIALDRRPADWGCEIDLKLAAAAPGEPDLQRASQLAALLGATPSQRGNNLTVSLGHGDPQWLTIAIHLRRPDLPALPGAAGKAQPQQAAP